MAVISDDNIGRRLTSDDKIQVTGVLDFVSGRSSTDIKLGLNTKLTRLTDYYTKQETDSKFANVSRIQAFSYPNMFSETRFFKLGRLNLPNGGNHATISINACYGYGTNSYGLVITQLLCISLSCDSTYVFIPCYQFTSCITWFSRFWRSMLQ